MKNSIISVLAVTTTLASWLASILFVKYSYIVVRVKVIVSS